MAINFPDSPSTNDIYTVGSRSWIWDGSVWKAYGMVPVISSSDGAPGSPAANQLWYESDTGKFYIRYDSAWVELFGGTTVHDASVLTGTTLASNVVASSLTSVGTLTGLSVTGYPNILGTFPLKGVVICTSGTRPGSPDDGTIAYETNTKRLVCYQSSNTTWYVMLAAGGYTITPTNVTLGTGGVASGEYAFYGTPSGGELVVWFSITLGTGGVLSGIPSIDLPSGFTEDASFAQLLPLGQAWLLDDSTTSDCLGVCRRGGAGIQIYQTTVSGSALNYTSPSATVPWTWAINDAIYGKAVIRGTFTA